MTDRNQPVSPSPKDDELMARVRLGDRAAFGGLVQRYEKLAWAVAYRFTGDFENARDLVQDAFLKVFESADGYRAEGKFPAFLLRVLANRALNLRRRNRVFYTDTVPEPRESPPAPDPVDQERRTAAVQAALSTLPPNQRLALVFRYYEDMSYEQIAAAMDTSVKAVERLIARGRDTLRQRLVLPR